MDVLEWMEEKQNKKKKQISLKTLISGKYFPIAVLGLICIISLAAGFIYTGRSRYIYFWDDSTYWDISRSAAKSLTGGNWLRTVYDSIGTMDYNYVAALPSALWVRLFGESRMAYVIGLITMYVVPSEILVYRLSVKLAEKRLFAFLTAVLTLPVTLYMACIGFVDVGGVLMGLICYNLYYSRDGIAKKWYRFAAIGALLMLMMIFRRYFAFFAVSFVTAMVVDCLLFKGKTRNLIIVCGVVGLLLITVFRDFLTGILLKDYGTLYSGYKYSVMTDMKLITRYYGLIFLAAAFIVPFVSFIKNKEYRPVFLWLQVLVCASMFMATQTHGQQHLLMYVPALSVIAIFMTNCVHGRAAFAAVCALAIANTVSPMIDRVQPSNIQQIKYLAAVPNYSVKPKQRDYTYEILTLKRNLDKFIPDGAVCGVLSSSFVLNDSILRNVEPSLGVKSNRDGDYIKALPEVDSRDYWRLDEIYNSEYVLVANPAQIHLAPGEQTIVTEGAASFIFKLDISEFFAEVDGFSCKVGDIDVKLYKRTDTVDAKTKREFEARLFY